MKSSLFQSKNRTPRLGLRGVILACTLGAVTSSAWAQPTMERAMRDRPVPRSNAINIPCCDPCSDKGGVQVIDLSTGVAPWSSTNGAVSNIGVYPGWKNPNPPASWVFAGSNNVGTYTYNLKINIPQNCVNPPRVSYSATAWGDNNITVRMDDKVLGTTAVSSRGQANYGFRDPYGVKIEGALSVGSHTLSVNVRNDESVTGFLLSGALRIECPPTGGIYTSGNQPQY